MSIHVSQASDAYAPANLVAGNAFLLLSEKVTIAADQTLTAGAVLGKSTNGKYYLASANDLAGDAIVDGRSAPVAILAHDTDSTGADTEALVYIRGDFLANVCYVDDSLAPTIAVIRTQLRDLGIFLVTAE